jgi:hypothetical protein
MMLNAVLIISSILLCHAQPSPSRQTWAWASGNLQAEETIQQLYNSTWSSIIDGIQVWCGVRFSDHGFEVNQSLWSGCQPILRAAKETKTKFQLIIAGSIPDTANVNTYIVQALAMHHHLHVDGFSLDDERDCAPRSTTDQFESWTSWQSQFARGLERQNIPVTSAIQAVFAINNKPGNQPCADNPSSYDLDSRVVSILQNATIQKWLVMDTYYFSTGRFLGALDWHVQNIPLKYLAIGLMNRTDLNENDLTARFHAIEKSGVDWINIFMMPIADQFLPFLQRWKHHCSGCGKQYILGCYDMTISCMDTSNAKSS